MIDRTETRLAALGRIDPATIERVSSNAHARIQNSLLRPAGERRSSRRRSLRIAGLAMVAAVLATGAALADGVDLASILPGYSVAQTPVVAQSDVAATLTPGEASTLAAMKLISGVDLSQLHRVRSARLGITVLIAPHLGGGVCTAYIQHIATFTQCGDAATLERGVMIKNDEGTLYVGLRPDGVTSVTDVAGNSVPVVDNVFISDRPIAA